VTPRRWSPQQIGTVRHKLIRWASGAVEFYDLENDPNELST
jgi:hypothetical protein